MPWLQSLRPDKNELESFSNDSNTGEAAKQSAYSRRASKYGSQELTKRAREFHELSMRTTNSVQQSGMTMPSMGSRQARRAGCKTGGPMSEETRAKLASQLATQSSLSSFLNAKIQNSEELKPAQKAKIVKAQRQFKQIEQGLHQLQKQAAAQTVKPRARSVLLEVKSNEPSDSFMDSRRRACSSMSEEVATELVDDWEERDISQQNIPLTMASRTGPKHAQLLDWHVQHRPTGKLTGEVKAAVKRTLDLSNLKKSMTSSIEEEADAQDRTFVQLEPSQDQIKQDLVNKAIAEPGPAATGVTSSHIIQLRKRNLSPTMRALATAQAVAEEGRKLGLKPFELRDSISSVSRRSNFEPEALNAEPSFLRTQILKFGRLYCSKGLTHVHKDVVDQHIARNKHDWFDPENFRGYLESPSYISNAGTPPRDSFSKLPPATRKISPTILGKVSGSKKGNKKTNSPLLASKPSLPKADALVKSSKQDHASISPQAAPSRHGPSNWEPSSSQSLETSLGTPLVDSANSPVKGGQHNRPVPPVIQTTTSKSSVVEESSHRIAFTTAATDGDVINARDVTPKFARTSGPGVSSLQSPTNADPDPDRVLSSSLPADVRRYAAQISI